MKDLFLGFQVNNTNSVGTTGGSQELSLKQWGISLCGTRLTVKFPIMNSGSMAQWIRRLPTEQEILGSSPGRVKYFWIKKTKITNYQQNLFALICTNIPLIVISKSRSTFQILVILASQLHLTAYFGGSVVFKVFFTKSAIYMKIATFFS